MKRTLWLAVLACLLLTPALAVHGESGIRLRYGANTYTIKQASLAKSGFPFAVNEKDGTVVLTDKKTGITASVRLTVMDDAAANALRSYYNETHSDRSMLFGKMVALSESYIDAALESFKTGYLYGDGGKPGTETNMKLFSRSDEKLYGQRSDLFIYNVIQSVNVGYKQETHIDIFVPIRSSYTLLNIHFTMKTGALDAKGIDIVNRMLVSIRPDAVPTQSGPLQVLKKQELVTSVNLGIYPNRALPGKQDTVCLEEPGQGFRLRYPPTLNPFMQNNVLGDFYYNSFKISPGEVVSISVEPVSSPDAALTGREASIRKKCGPTIKLTAEGIADISRSRSVFFNYTFSENDKPVYVQDYLTVNKGKLYSLKLESRDGTPSKYALDTFSEMLSSFEFIPVRASAVQALQKSIPAYTAYSDKNSGVSFLYPNDWKLSTVAPVAAENAGATDKGNQSLRLNVPGISDFLDIEIRQDELSSPALYDALQPTQLFSRTDVDGNITKTYRLVNYIDAGGRGRLCGTVDLQQNGKKYSMYILIHSGWAKNGRAPDAEIASIVDAIASSFRLDSRSKPPAAVKTAADPLRNQ